MASQETALDHTSPLRASLGARTQAIIGFLVWAACLIVPVPGKAQNDQIWPPLYENQWHWHDAQSNLAPETVSAILAEAAADAPRFRHPKYSNSIFALRRIKLAIKSHITCLDVEGKWQQVNGKASGSKSALVPIDPMTAATLWYMTGTQQWKWCVRIYPAPTYSFYFSNEALARRFIDAVSSARKRHAAPSKWLKFGMMTQDLTPAQAEDAGRPRVDSVFAGMVAIGGPADRAGIQPYDVIVNFDGTPVLNQDTFDQQADSTAPGKTVTFTILRRVRAPEGTKVQMPEGVRYPYIYEQRTVSVPAR